MRNAHYTVSLQMSCSVQPTMIKPKIFFYYDVKGRKEKSVAACGEQTAKIIHVIIILIINSTVYYSIIWMSLQGEVISLRFD